MTPIPIAIVLRTFDPGGTEHQMIELVRRLDRRRWTVHVACFRADGAWTDRVVDAAATVTEFPIRSFADGPGLVRHLGAFRDWCRERGITIVQTTGLPTNLFALPAAAAARVPVRIGARREINANRTLTQLMLQRASYACATKVIANSEAAAARLRREAVPDRKIEVIPNGLDTARFTHRDLTIAPRTVAIVANLRPEKRHDLLIDAAPAVLRQFPDARFLIIGDGPERERLAARVEARRVAGAFVFMGHQSDVPGCLAGAHIGVLCSSSEGFPNAVLEALASGLAVVASDLPSIRELIVHESSGLLVRPGDPEALAAALCRVMGDPALARRLGARGRSDTLHRFSFDRMVNAFERLYCRALGRGRDAAAARVARPLTR